MIGHALYLRCGSTIRVGTIGWLVYIPKQAMTYLRHGLREDDSLHLAYRIEVKRVSVICKDDESCLHMFRARSVRKLNTLTGLQHVRSGLPYLADAFLVGILVLWGTSLIQRPITSAESAMQNPVHMQVSPVNISTLATMPLFGLKKAVVPKKVVVVQSTLNLRLVGTVVAGKDSAAIIEAVGSKQKVYKIGDILQPGVTLKMITPDAIEVEHQGRIERILLPRHLLNHAPAVHIKAENVDPSYGYKF